MPRQRVSWVVNNVECRPGGLSRRRKSNYPKWAARVNRVTLKCLMPLRDRLKGHFDTEILDYQITLFSYYSAQ